MSLRFDGVSDYARLTGAAALGNSTSGTLLGWYRKEDSTADRDILVLSRSGSSGRIAISATAGNIKGLYSGDAGSAVNYAVATNTWVGLAITLTDSALNIYAFSGGTLTLIMSDTTFYAPSNLSNAFFGDTGSWSEAAFGCYCYGRYWSRVLSPAELTAEFGMTPSSGTPAASTTGLRGSWPMANATDTTDWSGVGNTLTISGAVTSTEEPTIGGGGASVFIPTQYRRTNALLRM